jgi:ribose transport system ATP-binding protein
MADPSATPFLRVRGIAKSYPGVQALAGVDFDVRRGEVHALVGENGAGKSTLVRILAGADTPDLGTIEIDGSAVKLANPKESERRGIAVIYQEFNLVGSLSVIENVMLGREPTRGIGIDRPAMRRITQEVLDKLGVSLPLDAEVATLSVAQQQMVEIAKALSVDARVIVMDEPSASLTGQEVDKLFAIVRTLAKAEVGVVYISHRLEEIFKIADRVTVFRDGRLVETGEIAKYTTDSLIRLMVGRSLDAHFPTLPPDPPMDKPLLSVRSATSPGRIDGVSLDLYPGEILGIAGLVGSGRTSLLRAICGADRLPKGWIELDGRRLVLRGPHDAIEAGLALVTEDRKAQGLVLGMSVRENVTLPHLELFAHWGSIDRREEADAVSKLVTELRVRTPSIEQLTRNLSGGNQQKVVLAKWLLEKARVVCFDEPTRGIDVGAKAEIYELMVALAKGGTGILMASSELPEVLGMSMRVAVMHKGRIAHVFERGEATQESVLRYATGTAA